MAITTFFKRHAILIAVAMLTGAGALTAPENHISSPVNLKNFTDTVWYDSVNYGSSIFFDFKNMREGQASTNSENSDLESHFGNPIVDCGNNEIHCLHGGFTFSIPKSSSIAAWNIYDYDCRMNGNQINGNVDCYSSNSERHLQYWIVDGYIDEFRLIVEGYPDDAFFYRSRDLGLSIKMLTNFR